MAEFTVVELTAEDTHPLRRAVLRNDTPTSVVTFSDDTTPGTVHLGVRDARGIVAVSTWILHPFFDEPAVQLRGMATAPNVQGRGVGALLLETGCERSASIVPLVWARARDTALSFYLHHGFAVEGDGFIDEATQKPHHLIVRRLQ